MQVNIEFSELIREHHIKFELPRTSKNSQRPITGKDSNKVKMAILNYRQNLQALLLTFFTFVAFASYHEGTGSTSWIQWTTVVVILFFSLTFDITFTDDSNFLFDPDADNWRRKTEAGMY